MATARQTEEAPQATPATEEVVNTVVDEKASVAPRRYFTTPGRDPFDEVEWEIRDAHIPGKNGPAFEQRGVEFPKFWSQTATNIVAQKYFRGRLASPERERSVKQMIGRVVSTIGAWGREGGYFASEEEAETFEAELKAILVNQYASFNSPVWFNVGFEARPQCSACQPWGALVSTPDGMVPIGQLVEEEQIGREVYDANGSTRIVAVQANGLKEVFRVTLRNGSFIEATGDHVVKAARARRTPAVWLRVDELRPGMRMHLYPHRAKVAERVPVAAGAGRLEEDPFVVSDDSGRLAAAEAALAGWLQADGFVGQYEEGTNRSLTMEFRVANDDEYDWVVSNLDLVFPDVHRHVRDVDTRDPSLTCRRIRLYGEELRDFVDRWQLLLRGTAMRVPERLWTASHDEITAYLRSVFQADGDVTVRRDNGTESGRVAFAVIGERWAEEIQILLNVVGIYSRRTRKVETRENRHDLHEIAISIGSERARFAELIGFVGQDKQQRLLESLTLRDPKTCPDLREEEIVSIESLGVQDVYDIQTESGEYLTNNIAVHNCFILSIEDSMESILDWIRREGIIFRGGSGSGVNLSRLRSSKEQLSKGGYASGPVSFMRGADASAGTIKSGGKTRRAAKMVILDVDHPDVEEFIWCKAREERKARVLEAAGYDMSLDSPDWASIQYQNANNSVRVTDAFMEAVLEGKEWNLTARTDGSVVETKNARELLRQIAEAAWECADPGVQYDTTINAWHTCPNSGRINASNPCFPGDARVHTTLGLLRFEELYELAQAGEEFRVYTHRATAEQPGTGVVASLPVAVMRNGVKPILRLRFANGQELRCTANHRLWTTNRGWVEAGQLTEEDRVLLNDSPTPASDAAWTLPVKIEALAGSFSRGGTVVQTALPERWSEGLGELLGHLVGDGWLTDVQTGWVYGGDDVADGLAASHEGMLRELVGGISRQRMENGTVQLRAGSRAVRDFFRGLGVASVRAHEKRVPASVFTAPPEVQAAFLRGLFGADGCVSRSENGKANRYVGLGSRSEALLKDVQRLLAAFGVRSRIYAVASSDTARSSYARSDGTEVEYASRQGFDLRITGTDLETFAAAIGFSSPRKQRALETLLAETERYRTTPDTTLVSREEDGQEVVYNLTEPLHHSYIVDGLVVANCSEYMHLDDSACNLASLNLMKFRREDGEFDVEAFEHAVDVVFLAQEIIVGYSSYPTPEIERNAKAYRQLGLGYANLGALLMARGLPYDSDEGRAYAAAITALMTGRAYRKSAEIARRMGPFAGYRPNAAAMLGVIAKHRAAVGNIDHSHSVPDDLLAAARRAWDEALELGEVAGFRNAQATVLAPTGTISFMMDCDTTGVEPDFSLVKSKKLVGGGEITIVNKTVPMALEKLGYAPSEVEEIVAYIDERNTIVGAPYVKTEHYPVFDCAIGERAIHYMGHVKMMGAVQPFISGALSKTVNLPEETTVEEISQLFVEAWQLGVKAIAIYRDNCKVAQPLAKKGEAAITLAPGGGQVVVSPLPQRRRLPDDRVEVGRKFKVGEYEGYIHVGLFEDGTPGDIFVDIAKEGTTLAGLMNSFMISVSLGLQYGVPLEVYVSKFSHMRFEPSGLTNDPDIRVAKSLVDYIFRWMGKKFLSPDQQEEAGILTPEVKQRLAAAYSEAGPEAAAAVAAVSEAPPPGQTALFNQWEDAIECSRCGGRMIRTGSCYTCRDCGTNTGCS
ncbi:MAG TPA: LAGLIDADG family homing endonuclease [Gaiellaceae bacterium]|nr:LAGLIDADG family homing endonuclease [Gaiellaceae bacterium]